MSKAKPCENSLDCLPNCNGGCLPVHCAAIMAEVSRQRIYALMAEEKIRAHKIAGTKLVCLNSLMEFQKETPRAKKTLDKVAKHRNPLGTNDLGNVPRGTK